MTIKTKSNSLINSWAEHESTCSAASAVSFKSVMKDVTDQNEKKIEKRFILLWKQSSSQIKSLKKYPFKNHDPILKEFFITKYVKDHCFLCSRPVILFINRKSNNKKLIWCINWILDCVRFGITKVRAGVTNLQTMFDLLIQWKK